MQNFSISDSEYQVLLQQLGEINQKLSGKHQDPKTVLLDNADAMRYLKVSRRTLMSWRSEGLISFSQVGSKLYYSLADIQEFIQRHRNKRFA